MTLIEAAVLGVVQGLTEFLPISSSAHLRVVPELLRAATNSPNAWQDPGTAYSAVIQLGSVVAVLTYFAKDLMKIAAGFFTAVKEKDYGATDVRLVGAIVLGTIPICVLGLIFKHVLEAADGPQRSLLVIGSASIGMALLLGLAERIGARKRHVEDMGAKDGLIVGLGQAMALIPGCSRSGSTLTAALFLGMEREGAARFSFLLGIPAIVLSGLLELKEMVGTHLDGAAITSLLVGLLFSTIVSYAAIWWMLSYLKKHSTLVFIAYRLIFGIGVITFWYLHH
jgi:undecaprenyl-diphosphatase